MKCLGQEGAVILKLFTNNFVTDVKFCREQGHESGNKSKTRQPSHNTQSSTQLRVF